MKQLLINLQIKSIILCLFLALLVSCNSSTNSLTLIPEDTNVITVVDVYSLYKKGNLKDIEELEFFKVFQREVRNEDKKVARFIEDIKEDPALSGLDLAKDMFMFYIDDASDEKYFCLALDVKDEEKFTEFIEDILDKGGVSFDLEKEKLYKYIIVKGEVVFAWDDKKMIMLGAQNRSSRENLDIAIESLFEIKENRQITSNKEFMSFYNDKKDVNFWMSTNVFKSQYEFKKIERELGFDIKDNTITAQVDFQDDKINLLTKVLPNDDLKKYVEKDDMFSHSFNKTIINYLPAKSYANASLAINPEAYYNMISEEMDTDKMERKFEKKMGFELKELFSSLKGSMVVDLSGFEEYEYEDFYYGKKTKTVPVMSLVFDLNSDKYLKKIIDEIPERKIEARNDYYEIEIDGDSSLFIAFNDEVCLLTNDKKSIKAFKDGGVSSKVLSNSDKRANLSDGGYYAYFNMNYDDYPKEVKKMFKDMQNDQEEKVFDIWTKFAKGMEVKMIDRYTLEFNLETQNKQKNSLQVLLESIDESFEQYSSY